MSSHDIEARVEHEIARVSAFSACPDGACRTFVLPGRYLNTNGVHVEFFDPDGWTLLGLYIKGPHYHVTAVCFDTKEEAIASEPALLAVLHLRFEGSL